MGKKCKKQKCCKNVVVETYSSYPYGYGGCGYGGGYPYANPYIYNRPICGNQYYERPLYERPLYDRPSVCNTGCPYR